MKTNWLAILLTSFIISSAHAAERKPLPQVDSLELGSRMALEDTEVEVGLEQNRLLQWFKTVNALQSEVQDLRGKVEELDYQLSVSKSSYEQELASLREQVEQLTGSTKIGKPKRAKVMPFTRSSEDVDSKALEFNPGISDAQMYQDAYQSLQSKDYEKARKKFKALIQQKPQSQYVPNAHYWLGEIYLVGHQWQQASQSFKEVIESYPAHQKAADALLKLGFVSYQQGLWSEARQYLQQVQQKYPHTVSARLAENRLVRMENEGV